MRISEAVFCGASFSSERNVVYGGISGEKSQRKLLQNPLTMWWTQDRRQAIASAQLNNKRLAIEMRLSSFQIMRKLLSALLATIFILAFSACTSTDKIANGSGEFMGILKYTGSVYSPVRSTESFKYKLLDINGGFIAYLDTTRFVTPSMNIYFDKLVVVSGNIEKIDDEKILRVKSIKFQR